MTETELEIHRQKLRVLARDVLVKWLAGQLKFLGESCVSDPQSHRELEDYWRLKLQEKSAEYQQIALQGFSPEWSDLFAGEFQVEFDEVVKMVERSLGISGGHKDQAERGT